MSARKSRRPSTRRALGEGVDRHPLRGERVGGSDRLLGRVEDGDQEVVDHEVERVVGLDLDAFGPAEELGHDDLEPGLLGDLAHERFTEVLAEFDTTAGNATTARSRTGDPQANQENSSSRAATSPRDFDE